mgnify:CR=1 FL=1
MFTDIANQTTRRLTAAQGYLELELPELALDELKSVEDPGPFVVPHLWMTGEALKAQGRYDEAIALLRHVARSLPPPASQQAWQSLTECLQESGRQASAQDGSTTIHNLDVQQSSATPVRQQTFDITIPHVGKLTLNLKPGSAVRVSIETGD